MLAFLASPMARIVGVASLIVVLLASCKVQTERLHNAKADLKEARAALYVPDAAGKPTKVTWKARAGALQRDFTTCKENTDTLRAGLDVQNNAVEALQAEGVRKAAAVAQARQAAAQAVRRAESAASELARFNPAGADECARLLSVNEALKELVP